MPTRTAADSAWPRCRPPNIRALPSGIRHRPAAKVGDDCVCALSQVGRGVVGVQSGAGMFDPVERSKVVQIAIDKLRATLAA